MEIPLIRAAGISAVLARSFARIFFRNAINIGLPLVRCDSSLIDQGDVLEVDLGAGLVRDVTKGVDITIVPLPPVMIQLLEDGGLMEHFRRYGTFNLSAAKPRG